MRTKDDTILTVKLMLFFELIDVDRMLDNTHDPIGKEQTLTLFKKEVINRTIL